MGPAEATGMPESSTFPPAPDPGPSANGSGRSPSVMFIIYMVIGFTATLACIMILTLLYFFIRCFLRRGRTADCDPEGSDCSMALAPRDIYLVVHPGGTTTVAYRDDELLEMKPRDKCAPCKRFVIELDATTPSSVSSSDFLIAASHPGSRILQFTPSSATSREFRVSRSSRSGSKRVLLFCDGSSPAAMSSHTPASTDTGTCSNELWESAEHLLESSQSPSFSRCETSSESPGCCTAPFLQAALGHAGVAQSQGASHRQNTGSSRQQSERGGEIQGSLRALHAVPAEGSVRPQSGGGAPSAQTQDGSGSRVMELELLCLNETLSNSGSPPRIYFNSLFRTSAAEGASQDQPEEGAPSGQDAKAEQH